MALITEESLLKMERARAKLADILKNKDVNVSEDEGVCSLVNKVDKIGKNDILHSIFDKTIQYFSDDEINQIPSGIFGNCKYLLDVDIPNVVTINSNAFSGCTYLQTINLPKVETIFTTAFYNTSIRKLYMPKIKSIGSWNINTGTFYVYIGDTAYLVNQAVTSTSLTMLVLGSKELCILEGKSFNMHKNGFIYVPRNLVEEYKEATNWTLFADKFVAIEDYVEEIKNIFPEWNYEEWLANQTGGEVIG